MPFRSLFGIVWVMLYSLIQLNLDHIEIFDDHWFQSLQVVQVEVASERFKTKILSESTPTFTGTSLSRAIGSLDPKLLVGENDLHPPK